MSLLHLAHFEEFDDHRLVAAINDSSSKLRGFIAIHRGGIEKPAFGATRFWHYRSEGEALRDALRLSRMMSYKSALAGLPYGGAKGVICEPHEKTGLRKPVILRAYAQKVNYFHGSFITGTDVGLNIQDLNVMRTKSPYMAGLGINPEKYTALGLLYAARATLKKLFGGEEISGKSFSIQGLGKVGGEFLKLIYRDGGIVWATDIDKEMVRKTKRRFPGIHITKPSEIHKKKVDIFSPCALACALNEKTIKELRCSAIVGGANNQLSHQTLGDELHKYGILYAPDYVVNSGGLISVADEFEHKKPSNERVLKRVRHIKDILEKIFIKSEQGGLPPHRIANQMAEQIFNKLI